MQSSSHPAADVPPPGASHISPRIPFPRGHPTQWAARRGSRGSFRRPVVQSVSDLKADMKTCVENIRSPRKIMKIRGSLMNYKIRLTKKTMPSAATFHPHCHQVHVARKNIILLILPVWSIPSTTILGRRL